MTNCLVMDDYLNIVRENGFLPKHFQRIISDINSKTLVFTDGELIFKFGVNKVGITNSEKQFIILSALVNKTTLFAIPRPIFFIKNEEYSLLVYKKVHGEIIGWRTFGNFTTNDKVKFSEHLGEALNELHYLLNNETELTMFFANKFSFDTEKSFCEFLLKKINNIDLSQDEKKYCWDAILNNLELFKMVDNDNNLILLHNDINLQNLVIRDNKVLGIFDFDNAEFSQPYSEFRFIYLHDKFSANIVIDRYFGNSKDMYKKDLLFLVGLSAGLSGIAHKKDFKSAFDLLKKHIENHKKVHHS